MGRTLSIRYRIEYRDNLLAMGKTCSDGLSKVDGKRCYMVGWSRGRPSAAKLEDWRKGTNASYQHGGCNAHISTGFGIIPHIHFARIVDQKTNRVVCEATMPAFEVA